ELHATVALASLEDLDERVAHRSRLAAAFRTALAEVAGVGFPAVAEQDTSTYKDLTMVVEPERFGLGAAELAAALRAEGIDSRRYYFPPVHRQKAYAHVAVTRPLPVTDRVAERVLSPPLWSQMTRPDIERVAGAVVRVQRHAPAVRRALQ
ncbi:MAG: DegT/DnrJ/EryC1/StrS family aminotransferase, partial [Actinomycetota bacterium]|nr:DegT/DnrJ/EryC1/StrS family aminotransferase [Actinomycetota bacterium]